MSDMDGRVSNGRTRGRRRIAAALCAGLLCMCALALCACSGDALKTTEDAGSASPEAAASASPASSGGEAEQGVGADGSDESADGADAAGSSEADAGSGESAGSEGSGESEAGSASEGSSAAGSAGSDSAAASEMRVSVVVDASAAGYGTFASATVSLSAGATVYDALCATGLPFSGGSGYVSSINGLSEFDFGATSGWTYTVNGTEPGVSCGSYTLSAGDSVVWRYVTSS